MGKRGVWWKFQNFIIKNRIYIHKITFYITVRNRKITNISICSFTLFFFIIMNSEILRDYTRGTAKLYLIDHQLCTITF